METAKDVRRPLLALGGTQSLRLPRSLRTNPDDAERFVLEAAPTPASHESALEVDAPSTSHLRRVRYGQLRQRRKAVGHLLRAEVLQRTDVHEKSSGSEKEAAA